MDRLYSKDFPVDFSQRSFWISFAAITFNPLFWNTAARLEHKTHFLTRLFRGNAHYGCYALALTIFSLGLLRDSLYKDALSAQPPSPFLFMAVIPPFVRQAVAGALIGSGLTLVLSSTYALGITGTYLGDYFGILLPAKVEGFPFNITGAPMYYGSAMQFLGYALWEGKAAGLVLSAWVLIVYLVALQFEDPFTEGIYKKRKRQNREVKNLTESVESLGPVDVVGTKRTTRSGLRRKDL